MRTGFLRPTVKHFPVNIVFSSRKKNISFEEIPSKNSYFQEKNIYLIQNYIMLLERFNIIFSIDLTDKILNCFEFRVSEKGSPKNILFCKILIYFQVHHKDKIEFEFFLLNQFQKFLFFPIFPLFYVGCKAYSVDEMK